MEALSILVVFAGMQHAYGQDAPAASPTPTPLPQNELGGQSSMDLIRLDGKMLNIPLRNAGVLRGTDTIEVDGKRLERGKDYSIDYPRGLIMLMVPVREGALLRASYRFDRVLEKTASGPGGASQLAQLKLQFAPGATATIGLGMVERSQGGALLMNDIYSLRTNFSGGSGKGFGAKGVFALSSRKAVDSNSLMERKNNADPGTTGQGTAIVQDLSGTIGGSKVQLKYQDIQKNFTGFSAFSDAGYDTAAIEALTKERGIKRTGFSISDVKLGGMKFSQGFDNTTEGKSAITRRDFGLAGNGMKFGFASRKVDANFKRFKDLSDADARILAFESGLTTESWFAELTQKSFAASLQSKAVEDSNSNGFARNALSFKAGKVGFAYSDQKVDPGFSRFQGIREQDWQQVAREQGLRRQNMSLNLGPISRQLKALDINQSQIRANEGRFSAMDLNAQGSNWSVQHYARSFDEGFTYANRMSESELMDNMNTIAKMYEPTGIGVRPEERNWFFQNSGIQRDMTRISFSPGKGIGIRFDHLNLKGRDGSGGLDFLHFKTPTSEMGMRLQNIGEDFNEISRMMQFERERMGDLKGIRKQDFWGNFQIGKQSNLQFNSMRTRLQGEVAERDQLSFNRSDLKFRYSRRKVSEGFEDAGRLIDPERELLRNMVGNEQRQMQLDWLLRRDLQVRLDWTDSQSQDDLIQGTFNHTLLNWNPDKFTKLEFYNYKQNVNSDNSLLNDTRIDRLLVNRVVPRFGMVQYEQEHRSYEGDGSPAGSMRNTVILEGNLNPDTKVRTEQSRTTYDNGDRENIQAHTVETKITKGAGVSLTDTSINRTGSRPSERKRNYGFWIDFGKGVRLNYGYNRDLNDAANGTLNSNVSLTGGTFGNLTFGNAGYQTQRWDRTRQRSLGNFSLQSTKPMNLGLIQGFKFNIGADTIRDYDLWQREQNVASASGKLFGLNASFDYLSQYVPQVRSRGIDRTFQFQTPSGPGSKLGVNFLYKMRTLPGEKEFAVRNVNIIAKPFKGYELVHSVQTYPEVPRGDVLLGSLLQPTRSISWKLSQTSPDQNTLFGLAWREDLNEQTRQMTRTATMDVTFFAKNASPLKLSYGLEQGDINNQRRSIHRYSLQYNQRPGPNQLFNLSVGNVSWQHGLSNTNSRENWSMRLEWQVRF